MARCRGKYWRPPCLTLAERADFLGRQGGKCGLCKEPLCLEDAQLDHSHRTNALRGLVHVRCNQRLRAYRDSPKAIRAEMAWLKLALAYLRNPPAKEIA